MGRKLSTFLPKHPKHEQPPFTHLVIPMKTEVQITREGYPDGTAHMFIDPWKSSAGPTQSTRDEKATDVYGKGLIPIACSPKSTPPPVGISPSDASLHAGPSPSLKQRPAKRKPAPIYIPKLAPNAKTRVEQVYPVERPRHMSSPNLQTRHSIPSATIGHSPNLLPTPERTYTTWNRKVVEPARMAQPPLPLHSTKPSSHATEVKIAVDTRRNTHATTKVRTLGTMMRTFFGGRKGRVHPKSAAVLITRNSSLKRVKSKASLSQERAAHHPHYVRARTSPRHRTFKDAKTSDKSRIPIEARDISRPMPLKRSIRKRKESLPSFLSITPRTAQ